MWLSKTKVLIVSNELSFVSFLNRVRVVDSNCIAASGQKGILTWTHPLSCYKVVCSLQQCGSSGPFLRLFSVSAILTAGLRGIVPIHEHPGLPSCSILLLFFIGGVLERVSCYCLSPWDRTGYLIELASLADQLAPRLRLSPPHIAGVISTHS